MHNLVDQNPDTAYLGATSQNLSRVASAMQKPVAEFWYGIKSCENDIVQLRESWMDPYVAGELWLVRGSARDVLVDTGSGIVSPEPIVRAIAAKPVLAVACNSFYDHAGGLHWFDEQACHRLDAKLIETPSVDSSLVAKYVRDEYFAAYPHAGFDPSSYRMRGARPTWLLEHGDSIDLGNRQLTVLAVPGVTAGSMAIWEASTGSLFTCDTLFDDPLERPYGPQNPAAFAESLRMLSALPVKAVYGGHFGRFSRARMLELVDRYFKRETAHCEPAAG